MDIRDHFQPDWSSEDLIRTLRSIVHFHLRRGYDHPTLSTTVVLHEAFIKVEASDSTPSFPARDDFARFMSRAIRNLLVDYGRKKNAKKRGGGVPHVPYNSMEPFVEGLTSEHVLDGTWEKTLGDAILELGERYPDMSEVLNLVYWDGLSTVQCAKALGKRPEEVSRARKFIRAWLLSRMSDVNRLKEG